MPDINTDNNQANMNVQNTGTNKRFPKILIVVIVGLLIIGGLAWSYSSGVFNFLGINKNTSNNNVPTVTLAPLTEAQKLEAAKVPEGMVYVPEGEYLSGINIDEKKYIDPVHAFKGVYISSFFIDKYEVTNKQFQDFITKYPEWQRKNNGSYLSGFGVRKISPSDPSYNDNSITIGTDNKQYIKINGELQLISPDNYDLNQVREERYNLPVKSVSWYAADAFCKTSNKRLPTAWEWEKAARGIDGRLYPWGNEENFNNTNFCSHECLDSIYRDNRFNDGYADYAPVGSFPKDLSPYGAYDMLGNVQEWTSTWEDPSVPNYDYLKNLPSKDPIGPENGRKKMAEGGSVISTKYLPTTNMLYEPRGLATPDKASSGFRCVADVIK